MRAENTQRHTALAERRPLIRSTLDRYPVNWCSLVNAEIQERKNGKVEPKKGCE